MNTVIILAAGKGTRMQADLNKQYLLLQGNPIIAYTIKAFEESPLIDNIILVINENDNKLFEELIVNKFKFEKITKIITGGKERQDSVKKGLAQVHKKTKIVLVHDGARPFVTNNIIKNCIEGATKYDAVSAGVPIKDTVKIIDEEKNVISTPKRSSLWITQTPQAFKVKVLTKAHLEANNDNFLGTDDASLVERMGVSVKMVDGDYKNFKITTPEDLVAAEAMINYIKTI